MRHLKTKSHWLLAAAFAIGGIASGDAFASSAFGLNARVQGVIFNAAEPDAATSVRVQGLIAAPGTTQDFLTPVCGYLYYMCKAGDEALCREQWKDLATSVKAGQCTMFTARRDQTGNLANVGRIRPFSEAPTSPDVYGARAGLGVMTMPCGPEFAAACTVPADGAGGVGGNSGVGGKAAGGAGGVAAAGKGGVGGGGAPGQAGAAGGGNGVGGTVASIGGVGGTVASTGGVGGSPTGTGSGGAGGTPATVDAGLDAAPDASVKDSKGGGCSVVGDHATSCGLWGASVLGLVVVLRRRRRGGA